MSWQSPEKIKQEATKRPPEGWSTYRVQKVDGFTGKNGIDYLKFTFEHENGAQFEWMISSESRRSDLLMLTKLCEYHGIAWEDDTSNETIATLLQGALNVLDLNVKWGNGDRTFLNDVALAGEGGLAEGEQAQSTLPKPEASKPEPAKAEPPKTVAKKRF